MVNVENLAVGDHLITADGRIEPIQWIGSKNINCDNRTKKEEVWPIRICASAFGEGHPNRDLFLSPDHAVFVDGMLIPIKYLVNGTSIAQIKRDSVTYFHVQLARHEVILAEGLRVESYLDLGYRDDFDPDDVSACSFSDVQRRPLADMAMHWEINGAAPLVITGTALTIARTRLAALATSRGKFDSRALR
jgi:hypothetical protein